MYLILGRGSPLGHILKLSASVINSLQNFGGGFRKLKLPLKMLDPLIGLFQKVKLSHCQVPEIGGGGFKKN